MTIASTGSTTQALRGRQATRATATATITHERRGVRRRAGHAIQAAAIITPTRAVIPAWPVSPLVQSTRAAPSIAIAAAAMPTLVQSIPATLPAGRRGRAGPTLLRPMPIEIDIAHVARLARLGLDAEDLEHYRDQLAVILEHAARVQAVDTTGVEPTAHPLGFTNAFREDESRPGLDRDEVLRSAPESRDGYFVAPPAMDQD